jgi:hypothetical protein
MCGGFCNKPTVFLSCRVKYLTVVQYCMLSYNLLFYQVVGEKPSLKSQMKKSLSNIVSLGNRAAAGASSAASKQVIKYDSNNSKIKSVVRSTCKLVCCNLI